jgi:hypothetical protein
MNADKIFIKQHYQIGLIGLIRFSRGVLRPFGFKIRVDLCFSSAFIGGQYRFTGSHVHMGSSAAAL